MTRVSGTLINKVCVCLFCGRESRERHYNVLMSTYEVISKLTEKPSDNNVVSGLQRLQEFLDK